MAHKPGAWLALAFANENKRQVIHYANSTGNTMTLNYGATQSVEWVTLNPYIDGVGVFV